MNIKNLWREPLMHFLFIGMAIFLLYDLTREGRSEVPDEIVVTSGQIEQLAANFKRTWMRPPTEDELAALVENHVMDEVFYREALAMGLDQNDPLVRRRLRMKLEFILEDLSAQEVKDEVLSAYFLEHPDKFITEPKVSFQQVYLNPDTRGDLAADAQELLASLNGGAVPESAGDPTLVPSEFRLATQRQIARSFGKRFAQEVVKLEPGGWTGPVLSSFGGHLLKVSDRVDAYLPELSDIRAVVEREYLAQRRREQKNLAYQKLREGYEVTIEPFPNGQGEGNDILATAQADEAAK